MKKELIEDERPDADEQDPETLHGEDVADEDGAAEATTEDGEEATTENGAETTTERAPLPDPVPTTDLNVQPQEQPAEVAGVAEPVIVIKGLMKAFGDHEVLRGVDLYVYKGENVVILGKSGTGKSVLIKCLVRLEWPDAGKISIFGQDLDTLNYGELNTLRIRVGFLFQNAALYDSMTVRENLGFPLRQHKKTMTKEKKDALILQMLDDVGLADSIDQLPSKLSGGQSKRIGLARTLILRPEVMLYDEPTTGLDTGTAREISELICKLRKKYNITSITITHDMACAKMTADRIVLMKDGIVYAEGSYEDLEQSGDEWIRSFFNF